jgi:hypothetical protein
MSVMVISAGPKRVKISERSNPSLAFYRPGPVIAFLSGSHEGASAQNFCPDKKTLRQFREHFFRKQNTFVTKIRGVVFA